MNLSKTLSVVYAVEDVLSRIVCQLHLCILGLFSSLVFLYNSDVKAISERTEVHNAKDAIGAYKNITDAINAAEAAANEAKRAADNALNVSHRLDTSKMKYTLLVSERIF